MGCAQGGTPVSGEWLGVLSLAALFIAIFVGFPIAFTLIAVALVFGYIEFGDIVFNLMTLQFFSVMKDTTLAAVPFFLFMGFLLEQSGLMARLFRATQLLLAPLAGSLYLAIIGTATIFGMASGIVGSSVTLLGVMAAPSIRKSGYDIRLAAGAITAGGTLGILIPPSVMLVVMAPVVGVPVTELFSAAIVPGLMLSFLYCAYTTIRCHLNPKLGPPLRMEERRPSTYVLRELAVGVVPMLIVIFATLGTIMAGLATPTDCAAVGAFVTVLMVFAYKELTWQRLRYAVFATLVMSSMILFLVAASNFFGAVFSRLGSATMIAESLLNLSLPPIVMLALILVIIFLLGWPLEWVPIVLIVVPILLPLVQKLGINLVWFCTLVAVCLQTAWLSPPVALSAYFLKGVVPDWDLKDINAGMMQFMVLQLAGLALVLVFPQLALWLPAALRD
ncbi:MAG: TRAP transporter large permease subunit [Betaproteobacteria bacterium]|nr:TRAP transporter large permease subunit [Betaproteobacteria bacterium]